MEAIDFWIPTKVKFGVDVVNRIGGICKPYGDRVILVTEGILHESGIIERIESILEKNGLKVITFDEVVPGAMSNTIDDGTHLAKVAKADCIIGLGGVRALCIARGIAMLSTNEGEIYDYFAELVQKEKGLPYIEIPSTTRNPFMFNDEFWTIDARNRDCRIVKLLPNFTRHIIIDPLISATLPKRFSATTTIDTIAWAVDGFTSKKSNYISDVMFKNALELIFNNLSVLMNKPEDINARTNLAMSGFLTGLGLSLSKPGIAAALSLVLNSKYQIPKSICTTILLTNVMDFNITAVPNKFVEIARLIGHDINDLTIIEAAIKGIELIKKMIIEFDLPLRLDDFNMKKDDLIEVAEETRHLEMINYIPRPVSIEDLYNILELAF